MKAAYVGILTTGTTSRMRGERLRAVTPGWDWEWVDTDVPMRGSARFWRSLAFRTKSGPAVAEINRHVSRATRGRRFDVVWVDKGVFLWPETVRLLRESARKMIHFTPDTAFHANRSRHFERAIDLYDLVVTTKSFEMGEYRRLKADAGLMLTTQGYDGTLHRPAASGRTRRREVVFVGLAEPDRERCMATLLARGVPVRLGGRGWGGFLKRHAEDPRLSFVGEGVFGDDYAGLIAGSRVGLGLLSKRFPELHTTRTFEIPACGTILATEKNTETGAFFADDEALFFESHEDLAEKVAGLLAQDDPALDRLAERGRRRVLSDGRDYDTILRSILSDPRLSP